MAGRSLLSTSTKGSENAGDISIIVNNRFSAESSSRLTTSTSGIGSGGSIHVQTEQFYLTENAFLRTTTFGGGSSGDITIFAGQVNMLEGGRVLASTQGQGRGGKIQINDSDSINLSGVSSNTSFSSGLYTTSGRRANNRGGEISLNTDNLQISDGAVLSAQTRSNFSGGNITVNANTIELSGGGQILTTAFSGGNAGQITVNASENVIFSGSDQNFAEREAQFGNLVVNDGPASGLFARTEGSGDGGAITVHSIQLSIQNGAQISAAADNSGDAGSLIIQAGLVNLQDRGQITASTVSSGSQEGIQLQGVDRLTVLDNSQITASTETGQAGSVSVNKDEAPANLVLISGNDSLLAAQATGEGGVAGSVDINTRQLIVEDEAAVTVSSPQGTAGDLNVTADVIILDNGTLSAETAANIAAAQNLAADEIAFPSQAGANIGLSGLELLLLRNESSISANALGDANGGNIIIDAPDGFIVGILPTGPNGSDITANAQRGDGGVINIAAQGLIGIEPRAALTPDNDITAISFEGGLPGSIIIDSLEVDPTQGLGELSTDLAVPPLSQSCQISSGSGRLVNIGRGGSTASPYEPLSSSSFLDDIYPAQQSIDPTDSAASSRAAAYPEQIVEARGWIVNERGEVMLVADVSEGAGRGGCYLGGG
ncbi:MAG: hypothetical protein QNJ46_30540 [Leptolyngbyaceae cyanobacterium MO_188.B28]|nr:hypothetical protein [Leptolyngbyaceae cyanobacterium MO_188.B28]